MLAMTGRPAANIEYSFEGRLLTPRPFSLVRTYMARGAVTIVIFEAEG